MDFDAARSDGNEEQPILGAKRENMRLDTETADLEFLPGHLRPQPCGLTCMPAVHQRLSYTVEVCFEIVAACDRKAVALTSLTACC